MSKVLSANRERERESKSTLASVVSFYMISTKASFLTMLFRIKLN